MSSIASHGARATTDGGQIGDRLGPSDSGVTTPPMTSVSRRTVAATTGRKADLEDAAGSGTGHAYGVAAQTDDRTPCDQPADAGSS